MNDESFENLKQLYAGVHAVRKDTIDKLFDLLGAHVDNDVFLQRTIGPVALFGVGSVEGALATAENTIIGAAADLCGVTPEQEVELLRNTVNDDCDN